MARKAKDRTTAYAKLVVDGKKLAGQSEIQACKRHLDDMQNKNFPYVFDVEEAERHIEIANTLTIGEGITAKKLELRGFQAFIIGSLFGWRKKRSKLRRYREAYIQMARQNGKSFLAGAMCNDFATFSGYQRGRIFCTATKQDQANIVWDEVDKFIESDADLMGLYKIRRYDRTITSLVTGTIIKAIGRDTKSADGFRSILTVADELHAHPNNQMYKLMQDGQLAVDNALMLAITTAGFELNSFCYDHYKFCKQVLSGNVQKDSLFVYIAELDDSDDIWEPKNWAKANPLQLWQDDENIDPSMVARMAEKAIEAQNKQGDELVNFQTKSLNQWVTYTGGMLLDMNKWQACGSEKTLQEMKGRECYLGIDLSSGGDLTSISLVFPQKSGKIYVWSHSYMPELRLQEHIKTDDAPYQIWASRGLITLTSNMYGIKTDYKAIVADLANMIDIYDLKILACGYDNHNAAAFLSDLEAVLDCDLVEVKQSARSLNDATIDFQLSVKAGLVEYDKQNALLTWSAINAVISRPNSFGEIKIDKMTAVKRIDPIDALIDAWKLYFLNKPKTDPNADADEWLNMMQKEGEEN